MALTSVPPVKLVLPSTPIQELIKSNTTNQIPDRYVVLDSTLESNGCVLPWMDSSIIIDLQLLFDFSSPCAQKELLKLRDALSSWGCFQLVNHGVASSLMDQLHSVGKEFFALPLEEKQKYSRSVEWFEGYGSDIVSEDQPINWNDRLHLRIHPPEQRNLKLWPDIVPNFRETLDEYASEMRKVLEIMLRAIAKSLSLEENTFSSQLGENGTFFARFNFYPPCPHPDALFINVGDQLEILSNGILKSSVHRAVIDKEKERMSVAVPSGVNIDTEIRPLSELINKDGPRLYKNVKDYIPIFLQHYARGERAINAVKIQQ